MTWLDSTFGESVAMTGNRLGAWDGAMRSERYGRFSRQTVIAACEALEGHTQASFSQMVLRLELEDDIPDDTRTSVRKKCARLAKLVLREDGAEIDTADGRMALAEAVIREAVATLRSWSLWEPQKRFEQALAREGFALRWDDAGFALRSESPPRLVPALPVAIGEDDPDDEVHELLRSKGFTQSAGHLDQALEAHTRGHWAAANSQLRAFLESLVEEIAGAVGIAGAGQLTPENRLAALCKEGFLSSAQREWSGDGKNYVNGLFKMLHSEGSHAGLSDADHSTFRVHVVLVTARLFLRRLEQGWRPDSVGAS